MKTIYEAYLEVNAKANRFQRATGFYSLSAVRAASGLSKEEFQAQLLRGAQEWGDIRLDEGTWALASEEEKAESFQLEGRKVLKMKCC